MKIRIFPGRVLPPVPLLVPSVLSGALTTLCFPTVSLGPVSLLALVPLFWALLHVRPSPRDAFRAGFLFGITCFVGMLWWIVKLIPSADVTIPWLMTPALLLLVLYLALYPAFHLLVVAYASRWRTLPFILSAPAVWVLLEVARCRGELAFPWGLLGYSLSDHPSLLQSAEWWGVYGLSFVIVLVNALVAGMVASHGPRARSACAIGACVLASALYLYGDRRVEQVDAMTGDTVRVAIAQPNIDLAIKWKPEFRDSSWAQINRQARIAHDQHAQLVVFPETCAPMFIENSPTHKSELLGEARWLELPIYVGFLDHKYTGPNKDLDIFNSSGVFRTDGTVEKYAKRHLLPFGESLPLSSRFRWLRKINFGQANFQAGPDSRPLDAGPVRFTPLICFESVFPELCREGVLEGTQLFVNITNDGWFGNTPGPFQHAQMCIARAVEFRRFLVRSANSGVSMVVAPSGEVREMIPLNQTRVITVPVLKLSGVTFYARHGDSPLVLASLLLLLAAWLASRRAAPR
ncbi:MAG TPA: apolipoprotein N-acyltransferase [Candidatus Krumholzibacteria bacterium]|nr:apolipoprotein N-acyltransferase [Candidatus Krumholzibacteria bacterium]